MGNSPLPSAPQASPEGYKVLARKYRPTDFNTLIGQEPLVQTLTNAFASGRIAQAWMLTGVRGVGKTTTARILARALNYEIPGVVSAPTVDMPQMGAHCAAIMESRHTDVLEMDAASRTGIDDVREILEGVRYAPVSARYKVYIIDEVHMLSDKAFNAFLKTLEEPPPHVKFIFATTEIRKVPVTVLSRCQRFSLRRVDAALLTRHLRNIVSAEGIAAEDEALALVARAAEGSVRDGLSILDQAIAHSGGHVVADAVRGMLGLSSRGRIVALFDAVMRGQAAEAVTLFRDLYDNGAEAATTLSDLAEYIHYVTRVKLTAAALEDPSITEAEATHAREAAPQLSQRVLARAWQILLKGITEVQNAPKPAQAADMVLVRLACAADLPFPDELLRTLGSSGGVASVPAGSPAPARNPSPAPMASVGAMRSNAALALAPAPATVSAPLPSPPAVEQVVPDVDTVVRVARFEDMPALAAQNRDMLLKLALEQDVHLVRFEDGMLEFRPSQKASPNLSMDIQNKFSQWTKRRWIVVVSRDEGQESLRSQNERKEQQLRSGVEQHPQMQDIFQKFPGIKIVNVRQTLPPAMEELPAQLSDDDTSL